METLILDNYVFFSSLMDYLRCFSGDEVLQTVEFKPYLKGFQRRASQSHYSVEFGLVKNAPLLW
jgi:hypothetical protein